MGSFLVLIPTLNESGNVERLVREILALGLDPDVLFVDDNSADGTGAILDALAAELRFVHVIHRPGRLGVGSAHATGIRWAYEHGYGELVTMDCDFTHDPRYIPALLAEGRRGADVVVCSRFLREDCLPGWNAYRRALTHLGHLLTRTLLGMSYDATTAFRWYRLTTVPDRVFDVVKSHGYSFFFESLYVLHRNGFRIAQIPVSLPKRTYGSSKMSVREIGKSVRLLGAICLRSLLRPATFDVGSVVEAPIAETPSPPDARVWDAYWDEQKGTRSWSRVYDAIASFYRRRIIRPSLNRFVRRYFRPGALVLHAGCGSGQVDADVRHDVSIVGLDFSPNALRLYRTVSRGHCRALRGDVLRIPLRDGAVDGVYNLGVMEHFDEEAIRKILREFRSVLKPDGRAIVFWPPEYVLSVLFFKGLGWLLRNLFRRKATKFHPDEITRIRSRAHAIQMFERSGFGVVQYYFGPRDLFTYAVVAAERIATPRTDTVSKPTLVGAGHRASADTRATGSYERS